MFNSDSKQKGPRQEEFGISCWASATVHCGKGLSLAHSRGASTPTGCKNISWSILTETWAPTRKSWLPCEDDSIKIHFVVVSVSHVRLVWKGPASSRHQWLQTSSVCLQLTVQGHTVTTELPACFPVQAVLVPGQPHVSAPHQSGPVDLGL